MDLSSLSDQEFLALEKYQKTKDLSSLSDEEFQIVERLSAQPQAATKEQPGLLKSAVNAIDSVVGAPTRAAINDVATKGLDSSPLSTFANQFGEDPSKAPTSGQLAENLGITKERAQQAGELLQKYPGAGAKIIGALLESHPEETRDFMVGASTDLPVLSALSKTGGLVAKVGPAAAEGVSKATKYVAEAAKPFAEAAEKLPLGIGKAVSMANTASEVLGAIVEGKPVMQVPKLQKIFGGKKQLEEFVSEVKEISGVEKKLKILDSQGNPIVQKGSNAFSKIIDSGVPQKVKALKSALVPEVYEKIKDSYVVSQIANNLDNLKKVAEVSPAALRVISYQDQGDSDGEEFDDADLPILGNNGAAIAGAASLVDAGLDDGDKLDALLSSVRGRQMLSKISTFKPNSRAMKEALNKVNENDYTVK